MNEIISEKLLTKEEACAYLGISYPTLSRWITSGKVTPIKKGRTVRFSKDSLTTQDIPEAVSQKGGLK
jgi:excisionase family DNA binding protein